MSTTINIPITAYPKLLAGLQELPASSLRAHLRNLVRTDLYFLLRYGLNRSDVEHPWLFARIREVQNAPDGYIDLWARGHYKSTIITYAKTIQDILASYGDDPLPEWEGIEPTVAIFSHTRPIAKGFMRQIKREFETNLLLKEWFPDILYQDPQSESPKWSEDDGIILKRKTNPKESSIEAWGLVDGQPTSRHYAIMIYDDVVTRESVSTPDMIRKTTEAWELSLNLGSRVTRRRHIGTRYHMNDTYREILKRNAANPRIYPATDDGTDTGTSIFLPPDVLAEQRRFMGPYTFAAQMLVNPAGDKTLSLKREWIRFHTAESAAGLNTYLLADPANEKKKTSDYTAMVVYGLGEDQNYYVLDMVYDRLNLTERTDELFRLHRKWKPIGVGYERYGKDADIEHIQDVQNRVNYRFEITELAGRLDKMDRIKRLIPILADGRLYLPKTIWRKNYEGRGEDIVEKFLTEEYDCFPVPVHDDMLDVMSRIFEEELHIVWPLSAEPERPKRYTVKSQTSFMGA